MHLCHFNTAFSRHISLNSSSSLPSIDSAHLFISRISCVHRWDPFDWDSEKSSATRRDLIAAYADTDLLVLGTHFAPTTSGHIRTGDDGVWFESSKS